MVAGDMNAGKRNPGRARAAGIASGEPDMRIYLPMGRTLFIELKTAKGNLSENQKKYHQKLKSLGHMVHIVKAASPGEAMEIIFAVCKLFL